MNGRRAKHLRSLARRLHAMLAAADAPSPGVDRLYHAGRREWVGRHRSAVKVPPAARRSMGDKSDAAVARGRAERAERARLLAADSWLREQPWMSIQRLRWAAGMRAAFLGDRRSA